MPGMTMGRSSGPNNLAPVARDFALAALQSILAGDLVVLTGVGGIIRVRKMTATDITNAFTESTVLKGILGVAAHDAGTDSNGFAANPITPATVAANARVLYPLPNYAAGIDADPVTGTSRLKVDLADPFNEFQAKVAGAGDTPVTVTPNLIGTTVGIQLNAVGEFKLNTGASGAGLCALITGVEENDPNYNKSSNQCRVFFKFLAGYQQFNLNGVLYAG